MEDPQQILQANDPTILHRLARWANEAGDRPCVSYGEQGRAITYAEFNRLTNRIAGSLKDLGVLKGDRISVFTGNSLVSVLAMFGIWKAGALYCPINAKLQGELLGYQIEDTSPLFILTDLGLLRTIRALDQQLPEMPPQIVHVPLPGDHDYAPDQQPVEAAGDMIMFSEMTCGHEATRDFDACASDLTSIIYTSGTTGSPKGVVQGHGWLRGLCSSLDVWTHPDDIIYCDLPMHHIGGAFSMFARAIWSGASVSLWDRFSPAEFWHRVHSSGASIVLLIDVMVNWILRQPESHDDAMNTLAKVHMLPLPGNHRDIARRFGFDFIIVGYGSSELGNAFSGFIDEFPDGQGTPTQLWKGYGKTLMRARLRAEYGEQVLVRADENIASGFMGVPVGLYKPLIKDERDVDVGIGEDGQLVLEPVSPEVLFTCYFNKPDKTADSIKLGRFYSADIVSRDERGAYYFKDRKQGFIRVRGENVSAASVEAELNKHAMVSQSAVVSVPAQEGSEDDIAAFVVITPGASLTTEELQQWTAATMPRFMQPRYLRIVDEIPVTTTMKVEKYKLRDSLLQEL